MAEEIKRKDSVPGVDRLWDSQWVNIVGDPSVLSAYDRDEAVAEAVKLTERVMGENARKNLQHMHDLVGKWLAIADGISADDAVSRTEARVRRYAAEDLEKILNPHNDESPR